MSRLDAIDALIIGAGHNGLVCAAYLAAKGVKVRILEKRDVVGGAAVTEEFHPGFRNSTASYTVSLLQPKIISDLKLAAHGLTIVERPFANFLPLPGDHGYLKIGGGLAATQGEIARHSRRDAEAYPRYVARLDRIVDVLRDLAWMTPPNAGDGIDDMLQVWTTARCFKALSMEARRDFVDLFTISAAEWLERWFESSPVKAVLGFDSIVGNFASPYTQGTAYMLLHHLIGEVNGNRGSWGHAIGGMGAITEAMAAEARLRGVQIDTGMSVERVLIDDAGRAAGVVLDNGDEIRAKAVIANVNPRLLLTRMIDADSQQRFDLGRFAHYQCESATLRMNVALSELPDFSALPGRVAAPHHGSGIIIAPSLDYMDSATTDARAHGWSAQPVVEMLVPSTLDSTLAPAGAHVASLFCQHFRYALPNGRHWDNAGERDQAADAAIAAVARFAPNFRDSIIARQIHTPLDLERKFGLTGGDIFHGRLTLNQLFSARPSLGHAKYRMPVPRLYLCGSGAHPGGGVSGIPGHNAAREIWRDRRQWLS